MKQTLRPLPPWPVLRPTRLLVSMLAVVLSGCAVLQSGPDAPAADPPALPEAAVAEAGRAAADGRWTKALALIDDAQRRFPDDARLSTYRQQLASRWARERRTIEDRIMVGDAENRRERVALLTALSHADPDDLIVMSRRIFWRERLQDHLDSLLDCAEWHIETDRDLAWRCYDVAAGIADAPLAEVRLKLLADRFAASAREQEQQRRQAAERERRQRVMALMDEARAAIGRRDFRSALAALDQVAALQPETDETAALRQVARDGLNPQVEALVRLGDRLYLNERLEAALATWRAALDLRPDDAEIVARIERANTVLDKLARLRREQRPAPEAPSPD